MEKILREIQTQKNNKLEIEFGLENLQRNGYTQ